MSPSYMVLPGAIRPPSDAIDVDPVSQRYGDWTRP